MSTKASAIRRPIPTVQTRSPRTSYAASTSCKSLAILTPEGWNFQVEDPTTEEFGAGAGPNFQGHIQARKNFSKTAGVIEGRPGIIESTHIEPLKENTSRQSHLSPGALTFHDFSHLSCILCRKRPMGGRWNNL